MALVDNAAEQGPAATVAGLIAKVADVQPEELSPQSRLVEDLHLDSLAAISLAIRIEQETGVRVDEEAAQGFHTVGDVIAFVEGAAASPKKATGD